jgi:ProP effector
MTAPARPLRRPNNPVLDQLAAAFPVFANAQPLAIGVHKAIKERLPEIDAAKLRLALKLHTASTRYLKALANSDTRFDLDGNPAGEITAEQKQQALDGLKERFRKAAERKRAEQEQKNEQERQARQQAKQQAKLQQLAEKFNTR